MKLVDDIKRRISSLGPPLSSECCIYRVPKQLRQLNPAAYTPQVVSIGPLHYGQESLKQMEAHKLRYLQCFLATATVSLNGLISYIKENETRIRKCYAETIDYLSSDRFVEMVLLDAAFIIQLFLRVREVIKPVVDGNNYDFITNKYFLRNNIYKDLRLLENQLPFFILNDLYDIAFRYSENMPSFFDLTLYYFKGRIEQEKPFPAKHFSDLIRYFYLPPDTDPPRPPLDATQTSCYNRGKNSIPCAIKLPKQNDENAAGLLYSATELHEAGVKFEVSQSQCILDIKFTEGKLVIPRFKMEDSTESLIRNLMALEQCHCPEDAKICNYIILMDYLINTAKDVELFVQKKILVNWLGDHQAVANLVNKLGLEIYETNNHYGDLFKELNDYYDVPYHRWKATLRHQYFMTPWRGASTIAAIIFLLLTFLQTIFSGISM